MTHHEPRIEIHALRCEQRSMGPLHGFKTLHMKQEMIDKHGYEPGWVPRMNQERSVFVTTTMPGAQNRIGSFHSLSELGMSELSMRQDVYDYYGDVPFQRSFNTEKIAHTMTPNIGFRGGKYDNTPSEADRRSAQPVPHDNSLWQRIAQPMLVGEDYLTRIVGADHITRFCAQFAIANGLHRDIPMLHEGNDHVFATPQDQFLWRINLAAYLNGIEPTKASAPDAHIERITQHIASGIRTLLNMADVIDETREMRKNIKRGDVGLDRNYQYVTQNEMGNMHRHISRPETFVLENTINMYGIDKEILLEQSFRHWLAHNWARGINAGKELEDFDFGHYDRPLDMNGAARFEQTKTAEEIESYRELMRTIVHTVTTYERVRDLVLPDENHSSHHMRNLSDAIAQLDN